MTVVFLGVGWFVGLWLASMTDLSLPIWLLVSGVGLVGAILTRRWRRVRLVLACAGAVGLGGGRYVTAVPTIDESHIAYYNDAQEVTLTGLVVDEPDVRDRFVNLRLEVDSITLPDSQPQLVSGQLLVRTFRFPVIEYGTRLEINGRPETPPEDETFSYKDYLARQNIHSLMALPRLTVLAEGEGHPIKQAIFALKNRAHATINQLIPDPQAALLSGILLGDDNGIAPDLADAFRVTGMTHIIAISGFNITILISVLGGIGDSFLSRRGAAVFALIGVALYTVLVGADASVVRAALMGSIYLLTKQMMGRPNYPYASLFLAGFLMTLFQPFALWDVGFQLSFTATLGLMLYAGPFTQWTRTRLLGWLEKRAVKPLMNLLSDAVLLTLAAQILTIPLMIAYFKQLSLISLPANALILPVQPAVMAWGGLTAVTGLIVPAIGQLFGWIAWLFLTYTIVLVRAFAAVPGAAVPVQVSTTGVIMIYGVITAVTWLAKQPLQKRTRLLSRLRHKLTQRLAFGGGLIAVLLTISWSLTQPDGQLHVAFMDVGQGDAIFIQTPSGRQILVDGGLYPTVLNDQLGRQMPFWDKEIDVMVATHPDADHISGLVSVFDRYRVVQLITDGEGVGESLVYDEVLLAAEAAGTDIRRALAGEVIVIEDGVRLEMLHPGPELLPEGRNENSVSMRLVYGDFTLLLTGDAEEKAERMMLANGYPLSAIVFKAGHHGSNSSSSMPFLQAVSPQIIIISVGAENRFGHPQPEMLQRAQDIGAAVLRTDELGTIEVISDGRTMWWQAVP